jgi:hypothetical protein
MPGFRKPAACPTQLTMLYWVSNIHFQAIELRTIGTVQGSRMMKRNTRVPGTFSASRNARVVPSSPLKTAETAVNMIVFRNAIKNWGAENNETKLSRPTKLPSPTVATLASLIAK